MNKQAILGVFGYISKEFKVLKETVKWTEQLYFFSTFLLESLSDHFDFLLF